MTGGARAKGENWRKEEWEPVLKKSCLLSTILEMEADTPLQAPSLLLPRGPAASSGTPGLRGQPRVQAGHGAPGSASPRAASAGSQRQPGLLRASLRGPPPWECFWPQEYRRKGNGSYLQKPWGALGWVEARSAADHA